MAPVKKSTEGSKYCLKKEVLDGVVHYTRTEDAAKPPVRFLKTDRLCPLWDRDSPREKQLSEGLCLLDYDIVQEAVREVLLVTLTVLVQVSCTTHWQSGLQLEVLRVAGRCFVSDIVQASRPGWVHLEVRSFCP